MDLDAAIRAACLVGVNAFDLLMLGDGSGMTLADPSGWHVQVFSRKGKTWEFSGCTSNGTTNQAEIAPYLHALWAIDSEVFGTRPPPRPVAVEILTDSQITVGCGNGNYTPKANGSLWAQLDWFKSRGYRLRFHHVPRNSTPFHERSDSISRIWRKAATSLLLTNQNSL